MKTTHTVLAALLTGTMAGVAASTDDVGGPGPAIMVLFFAEIALALMSLPALYILFRGGLGWARKLRWFLALAAVDLGSCGLLYMAFFGGGNGDAMFSPIPWILVLVPGYVLAYFYKVAGDKLASV